MSALLVAPLALPLAAGALGALLRNSLRAQRAVSVVALAGNLAVGVALVARTIGAGPVATRVGGWPQGIAIPFAADPFAALMLTVAALMALVSVGFATARGEDRHELFHPMVCVLIAGVSGAFLTADLFNLFVMFEVMLIASYVLLTLRAGRDQVRAGAIYVATSLLASTIFLLGVALVYGRVGSVEMSQLHAAAADRGAAVGLAVVLVAVGLKASLVPLHAWLPRTYVMAGPAVTALFSGLLTKAGVYVLYRLHSVAFAGQETWQPLFVVIATVTMVVGVLGAVGSGDMRGILSFHMVSQVGYLVLPLGIWTVAGVTGGIAYTLQYIAVKGALFLSAGAVETLTGTGRLERLGGMARTRPLLAVGFLLPALALAGIPPTSGFVGKMLLVLGAFEAGHLIAGGVAVAVSFLTLMSMVKIWNGVFWGSETPAVQQERVGAVAGVPVPAGGSGERTPPQSADASAPPARWRVAALCAPSVVIGLATVALGLGGVWLVGLAEPAAEALVDPSAYLEAVTGS